MSLSVMQKSHRNFRGNSSNSSAIFVMLGSTAFADPSSPLLLAASTEEDTTKEDKEAIRHKDVCRLEGSQKRGALLRSPGGWRGFDVLQKTESFFEGLSCERLQRKFQDYQKKSLGESTRMQYSRNSSDDFPHQLPLLHPMDSMKQPHTSVSCLYLLRCCRPPSLLLAC
jgi:hypothetical protein